MRTILDCYRIKEQIVLVNGSMEYVTIETCANPFVAHAEAEAYQKTTPNKIVIIHETEIELEIEDWE